MTTKRAVLIGIRTYPLIDKSVGGDLRACHNDVETMADVLKLYGFEDGGVRILVDRLPPEECSCRYCQDPAIPVQVPSRDDIRAAVREMTDASDSDDVALVYYSGHGSEVTTRTVEKGRETEDLFVGIRFQTFVPWDSGRRGNPNRDIADREVADWIRELNFKTPNVTLIFDSCYSGGVTRGDGTVRQLPPDDRPPEEMYEGGEMDAETRRALEKLADFEEQGGSYGGETTGRTSSGWVWTPGRSAVVLSACGAHQTSTETRTPEGRYHGLFTLHLTKTLREVAGQNREWKDVFKELVATPVSAEKLSQQPRLEGNGPILAPVVAPNKIEDFAEPPDFVQLRKYAVVIGIDYRYDQAADDDPDDKTPRFPSLLAPKDDAAAVAKALAESQGYEIVGLSSKEPGALLNEKATRKNILSVIHRLSRIKVRLFPDSSVVIYFAGHGVVRNEEGDDKEQGGSRGYVIPWDADRNDPSTWLPMQALRDHLVDGIFDEQYLASLGRTKKETLYPLKSRHLLMILDCCFGGAMSFGFMRGKAPAGRPIYYSEYKRFVEGTAWELLTSASYNQQALDRDPRKKGKKHSPFAEALLEGLTTGAADGFRAGGREDHIITAGELNAFIDGYLRQEGVDVQTPGLMPLRPLQGEFIFFVPGYSPTPAPDPVLDKDANPWQSDKPCASGEAGEPLFFGREQATLDLLAHFMLTEKPLAVLGPTGSGTTSLVLAGLLPLLRDVENGRRRVAHWAKALFGMSPDDAREMHDGIDRILLTDPELQGRVVRTLGEDPEKLTETFNSSDNEAKEALTERLLSAITPAVRNELLADLLEDPKVFAEKVETWLIMNFPKRSQSSAERFQTRLKMEQFGLASPDDDKGVPTWAERLRIRSLVKDPDELARLTRTAAGLSAYMETEDYKSWTVLVDQLPDAPDPRTLVFFNDFDDMAADVTRIDDLRRIEELCKEGVRFVVAGCQRPERFHATMKWRTYQVPRPTHEELREMIEGPAAATVLFFEPPELVDEIVAEVAATRLPVAALAVFMGEIYKTAVEEDGNLERQITGNDVGPPGQLAKILARRAEQALVQNFDGEERQAVRNFLRQRLANWPEGDESTPTRDVSWQELDHLNVPSMECLLADGDNEWAGKRRTELEWLREKVLPVFSKARTLVVGGKGLCLASDGLIAEWKEVFTPQPKRERQAPQHEAPPHDRPTVDLALLVQSTWRRARDWETSGKSQGKLADRDPEIHLLQHNSQILNRLEWDFIEASEREHLRHLVNELAEESGNQEKAWTRSILLAIRALEIGENERCREQEHANFRAEQALRNVLARTPLSISGVLDGTIDGMAFIDDEKTGDHGTALAVRLRRKDGKHEVHAWRLPDLVHYLQTGEDAVSKHAGEARVPYYYSKSQDFDGWYFPTQESVFGLQARGSIGKTIRYSVIGQEGSVELLGLENIPEFINFAHPADTTPYPAKGEWLAAAARLPGKKNPQGPEEHAEERTEIRLWKIWDKTLSGFPSEPATLAISAGINVEHTPQVDVTFLDGNILLADVGERTFHLWDVGEKFSEEFLWTPPRVVPWFPGGAPEAVVTSGKGWLIGRDAGEANIVAQPHERSGKRVQVPDGARILAVSPNGKIVVAEEPAGMEAAAYQESKKVGCPWGKGHAVVSPTFSRDSKNLVFQTLSEDGVPGAIRIWETAGSDSHTVEVPLPKVEDLVHMFSFSPDGTWLAAVTQPRHKSHREQRHAWLWRLTDSGVEAPNALGDDLGRISVTTLAFNDDPGDVRLAIGTDDSMEPAIVVPSLKVKLSPRGPTPVGRVEVKGPPGEVTTVAFSRDDGRWAAGTLAGTVLLGYLPPAGETPEEAHHRPPPIQLVSPRGRTLEVESLAFSEKGDRLAVARRTPDVPHQHQVDVYRLDVKELTALARACVGRELMPQDLRRDLWEQLQAETHAGHGHGERRPKRIKEKRRRLALPEASNEKDRSDSIDRKEN